MGVAYQQSSMTHTCAVFWNTRHTHRSCFFSRTRLWEGAWDLARRAGGSSLCVAKIQRIMGTIGVIQLDPY